MAATSASNLSRRHGRRNYNLALLPVLLLVVLALLRPVGTQAHPMPDSGVAIRIQNERWSMRLTVPYDRLAMALISTRRMPDPGPGFTQYPVPANAIVQRYVRDTLRLSGEDGRPWRLVVGAIIRPTPTQRFGTIDVEAFPPPGDAGRSARLAYDVIIRDVMPDAAIVSLEQDWSSGLLPGQNRLIGKLERDARVVDVSAGAGGSAKAIASMIDLGIRHIAEGADHIAFLVTLLLTVTLLAVDGRWTSEAGNGRVLGNTLWRVSAFTAGHTLSLLATSLGWLPLAGKGVETIIALSVAISAAHAIVPIYPRREAWVAAGFGLVHGMAFATAIRDFRLSTAQTVLATLGFNLGIEIAQMVIVAVVVPLLLMLRSRPWEPWVRISVALATLVVALWWAWGRILGD